jgi:hypothetical protein
LSNGYTLVELKHCACRSGRELMKRAIRFVMELKKIADGYRSRKKRDPGMVMS